MIRVIQPGPGSQILWSKRHRIPDADPQHWVSSPAATAVTFSQLSSSLPSTQSGAPSHCHVLNTQWPLAHRNCQSWPKSGLLPTIDKIFRPSQLKKTRLGKNIPDWIFNLIKSEQILQQRLRIFFYIYGSFYDKKVKWTAL
jgi:hypothetical protein